MDMHNGLRTKSGKGMIVIANVSEKHVAIQVAADSMYIFYSLDCFVAPLRAMTKATLPRPPSLNLVSFPGLDPVLVGLK